MNLTTSFSEVEDHAMTLRSLNDNKSAYISIEFSSDYFDNYNLSSDTAFACKLSVKVRSNKLSQPHFMDVYCSQYA